MAVKVSHQMGVQVGHWQLTQWHSRNLKITNIHIIVTFFQSLVVFSLQWIRTLVTPP